MATDLGELQNKLWEAADQFRANSGLKASEYASPVLGLIFLRYADERFKRAAEVVGLGSARRPTGPDDYQAIGALYLPEVNDFRETRSFSSHHQVAAGREAMGIVDKNDRRGSFTAEQAVPNRGPALERVGTVDDGEDDAVRDRCAQGVGCADLAGGDDRRPRRPVRWSAAGGKLATPVPNTRVVGADGHCQVGRTVMHRRPLSAPHDLGEVGMQCPPPPRLDDSAHRQRRGQNRQLLFEFGQSATMVAPVAPAPLPPGSYRDHRPQRREAREQRAEQQRDHRTGDDRQQDPRHRQYLVLGRLRRFTRRLEPREVHIRKLTRRTVERDRTARSTQCGGDRRWSIVLRRAQHQASGADAHNPADRKHHRNARRRNMTVHRGAVARTVVDDLGGRDAAVAN